MKEEALKFAAMFALIALLGGVAIGWICLGVWLIPFFKSLGEPFGAGAFLFFLFVVPLASGVGVAYALSSDGD